MQPPPIFRGAGSVAQRPIVTPGPGTEGAPLLPEPVAPGNPEVQRLPAVVEQQPPQAEPPLFSGLTSALPFDVSWLPFLQPPSPPLPQYGYTFGLDGPVPYQYGWITRGNLAYLWPAPTRGTPGRFWILEKNGEYQITKPFWGDSIISTDVFFAVRVWEGPPAAHLPRDTFGYGLNLEWASAEYNGWNAVAAFGSSLNTDFREHMTSDAWNYQGRSMLFYRSSPTLEWAMGAAYWHRVRDRIIPYAGMIWTPNNQTQLRLLFPHSRAEHFLGTPLGIATWLYADGQYNVEAYQIRLTTGQPEKIELVDWRVVMGLRTSYRQINSFVEGGWVFGRQVNFLRGSPGFGIAPGFILRLGIHF